MTRIPITKYDIDNGIRDSCNKCPIAKALNRTYNEAGCFSIRVLNEVVYIVDTRYRTFKTLPLNSEAKAFIAMFDELGKESVVPFELNIEWEFPDIDDNGMQITSEFDFNHSSQK